MADFLFVNHVIFKGQPQLAFHQRVAGLKLADHDIQRQC